MSRRKLAELLNEILLSRFFVVSCSFTEAQLKAQEDRTCLLQGMMLLDTRYVPGFVLRDFSEGSVSVYWESIRESYSDKQSIMLKSAIQYLTDAFPERNPYLKKNSIPMVVYVSDMAMDTGIEPISFGQWWEFFTKEDPVFEAYRSFCGSGSTEPEKVCGRLAVMAKSFAAYHVQEFQRGADGKNGDIWDSAGGAHAARELLRLLHRGERRSVPDSVD